MEKRNGYKNQSSALWRSLRDGDFEEADVWAVLKENNDNSKLDRQSPFQVHGNNLSITSSSPRTITRTSSNSTMKQQQQYSAPVKIPDWSKISRKIKSKKKAHHDDGDDHGRLDDDDDDDSDGDDVYDCKVPPHEFVAERMARSQIPSFSVFEGVGRTLKGRDLSKVRNAILSKTGFLE